MGRTKNSTEDEELAARLARGDDDALKILSSRYGLFVVAALRKHCGWLAEEDIEEVYNDSLLELKRRAAKYDGTKRSLKSWFFFVARRNALDQLEKPKKEGKGPPKTLDFDDDFWDVQEAPEPVRSIPDQSDPRIAIANQVLSELNENERAIFLADCESNGKADLKVVAGWLGTTPGALKVARHRALQKIKAALARLDKKS